MNLDDLKKSWDAVERKVQATQSFNEKLMEKIFSTRVASNLERIRVQYFSFYTILTIECVVLTAIMLGNPFDFHYNAQFIPFALLLIGVVIAFVNLAMLHYKITTVSSDGRVVDYLREIISIYDRNKRFEKTFAITLLTVGLSVPFAFLPNKVVAGGSIWAGLLETAIPLATSIIMFVVANKLGLFRNKHKEKFANDLKEWEELRSLSENLRREG